MGMSNTLLIFLVAVLTVPFLWARWWPHVKDETKKKKSSGEVADEG
jgi:hypothetical protein